MVVYGSLPRFAARAGSCQETVRYDREHPISREVNPAPADCWPRAIGAGQRHDFLAFPQS